MVGLLKNNEKVPFISLEQFIDYDKLNKCLLELEEYRLKQENYGADVIIGYKGGDWNSDVFMDKVYKILPKTYDYVMTFCDKNTPYNILYTPENNNFLLLHQDISPFPSQPWDTLIPNYKNTLTDSYYKLLKNRNDFKIVDNISEVNPIYNGIDYDFDSALKKETNYEKIIKDSYKLHLVLSDTKTLFIYDNVIDKIYHFDSKAVLFNARDFHDSLLPSWGFSIQFSMNPHFLNKEIMKFCELTYS